MTPLSPYLARLREHYPLPPWLDGDSGVVPDALPTPFMIDAVVAGGSLREWRVVFDPNARRLGEGVSQPRSLKSADLLDSLARSQALEGVSKRLLTATVLADRVGLARSATHDLLAPPPWEDGLKANVDTLRVGDLVLVGAPVVLTGPLGSGKSTYCRWLANLMAGRRLRDAGSPIPILVDVRHAAPILSPAISSSHLISMDLLCGAVLANLGLPNVDPRLLSSEWHDQRAFLLIDGLDEISVVLSPKTAGSFETALVNTLKAASKDSSRIVATARPESNAVALLDGFLEVEFAPLTVAEAIRLLRTSPPIAAMTPQRLTAIVSAVPEELRTRPLFLSLVGRLALEDRLPEHLTRWTLLDASLRELLAVRLVDKGGFANVEEFLGCSYESVVSALQEAAFEAELAGEGEEEAGNLSLDIGRLMALLYDRDTDTHVSRVLALLSRDSGLMTRRDARLEFTHRVFQSLLTAGFLLREAGTVRDHSRLLEALRSAPHAVHDSAELYVESLSSGRRLNDLLDLCEASLDESDSAKHRRQSGLYVWLAARALQEVGQMGHRLSRRDAVVVDAFVERAVDYVGDTAGLPVRERVLIAEQIGIWGDPRDGVGIDRLGIPSHAWVDVDGGEAALGLSPQMLERLRAEGIDNFTREVPSVLARVDAFAISLYPTTWTQYRAFLTATDGYSNGRWWQGWGASSERGNPGRLAELISSSAIGNAPVVGVDWFEAVAYCRWLSHQSGEAIDLPTEDEWELAARGGSESLFPWGDQFEPALLNWVGSGLGRVIPVGCFERSASGRVLGPSDMIGNVWEWTRSIAGEPGQEHFAVLGQASAELMPASPVRRVVRGGCYLNDRPLLRSTYRGNDLAESRYDRQGFRVVRRDVTVEVDA